jgi:hypothetical protein
MKPTETKKQRQNKGEKEGKKRRAIKNKQKKDWLIISHLSIPLISSNFHANLKHQLLVHELSTT